MRVEGAVRRGEPFDITFDGVPLQAFPGETIAAALFAAGRRVLRRTALAGEPRSLFCGMGICHDCLVVVNGEPNVRACATPASPGMRIETQIGAGPMRESA